ncbi:hypothetical protein CWE09_11325 [Aliidiomarina minuta]|uniref:Uncharacterized protein n=1 Tax=Aliidiomarina minuta TaxID=880057 RepID=A0A432W4N5_9GAMM|nr:hypothetical protein [Aliidiomarina minuta]RUO24446.1 hypothetical protein CWE09_11325 [Aliidiomarina minuta]
MSRETEDGRKPATILDGENHPAIEGATWAGLTMPFIWLLFKGPSEGYMFYYNIWVWFPFFIWLFTAFTIGCLSKGNSEKKGTVALYLGMTVLTVFFWTTRLIVGKEVDMTPLLYIWS